MTPRCRNWPSTPSSRSLRRSNISPQKGKTRSRVRPARVMANLLDESEFGAAANYNQDEA
jgi:hypothetical protein